MRERQATRELAVPPLTDGKSLLLILPFLGGVVLAGNRQPVVDHINVDLQILFCETRQLECRGHKVGLTIIVEVHPVEPAVSILPPTSKQYHVNPRLTWGARGRLIGYFRPAHVVASEIPQY